MKEKIMKKIKVEPGQILPIIVLMMFVIIGMVALILDGGFIMSSRRAAQAAADAGALAGAQRICAGHSDAAAIAHQFATVNNETSFASVTVDGRLVNVRTTIEGSSFFARIFGEDFLRATAEAEAGCFYPSKGDRMLPIAFFYESPPVNAENAVCDEDGACGLVNYDFNDLLTTLASTNVHDQPLDDIYIVSEKTKICEKDVVGEIVCYEMAAHESGGNRTWIDLDELNDKPKNLERVIEEGIDHPIIMPAWINGQPGVNSAVYNRTNFTGLEPIPGYEDFEWRLVLVPVFDEYCLKDPATNCAAPGDNFYLVNENQQSYRLVGLAPFVVTCVTKSDGCEFGECIPKKTGENTSNKDMCPGYLASDPSQTTDKNAIEGYFVENVPVDSYSWGTEGVPAGLYLISLSK